MWINKLVVIITKNMYICMPLKTKKEEKWRNVQIYMVFDDFPFWLRFAHFINLIFITLLIRSGIEILSSLPKLYFQ
jgi:hypothetical protein